MASSKLSGRDIQPAFNEAPVKCPCISETPEIIEFVKTLPGSERQEKIKQELLEIFNLIFKEPNRDSRKTKFDAYVKDDNGLSVDARKLFDLIERREATHIHFMYVIWPKIYKLQYKEDIPKEWAFHDHTKDLLFMFVMAARFDLKVDHEGMGQLVKEELDRHYYHEPHHPEFERERNRECLEPDILEMAVDRMARNMQNANGKVDRPRTGRMNKEKFLPKFHLGDEKTKKKKEEKYWEFVERYREDMEKYWAEIYGEQFRQRELKRSGDPIQVQQGARK